MQTAPSTADTAKAQVPSPIVRAKVRDLLMQSEAYRKLPAATQQQVARDTARAADYLVSPEGYDGRKLSTGLAAPAQAMAEEATFQERQAAVDAITDEPFRAEAAREGAAVAGELLREVKFTEFVGGLIEGVFRSIVTSSIEQMEAYSSMIADVAKSLDQFMQDNVTENQGRDHMVDRFPDLFEIGFDDFSDTPGPRLQLREDVDENDALRQVNNSITFEDGELKSLDLSDENVEKALVHNARLQLAKQRQQLMASLILMGINRIVVTDGRISAKILYDFRAKDRRTTRRSATAMDVARDREGNVVQIRSGEGEYDSGRTVDYSRDRSEDTTDYSSDYYAKGKYKYENKPVVTAMSSAATGSDAQIQTKVQLAGNVEVNFKSDYLPLDSMATPGMIAAIQGNSTPVDPNVIPSARQAPGARNGQTGNPGQGSGTLAPPPTG
jgi:hypothetical protein